MNLAFFGLLALSKQTSLLFREGWAEYAVSKSTIGQTGLSARMPYRERLSIQIGNGRVSRNREGFQTIVLVHEVC